jgi:hypothetical protein
MACGRVHQTKGNMACRGVHEINGNIPIENFGVSPKNRDLTEEPYAACL